MKKSISRSAKSSETGKKKCKPGEDRAANAKPESMGIDLGDRNSNYAVIGTEGVVMEEGKCPTTEPKLRALLSGFPRLIVVLEVGTHSPWVSRLVTQCGHQAIVANPRKVALISGNKRKNNRIDALTLGRLGRVDVQLLSPIQHRGEQAQSDLSLLRARDAIVRARTRLISHVRGAVKSIGQRLPRCSAEAFGKRCHDLIPEALIASAQPIVEEIERLTQVIQGYDRAVTKMLERYPAVNHLMQVVGVGELTSLAYVLVLEDAHRFARSRATGAYLGLIPGSDDTGDEHVQKRITKEGDKFLRRLMVSSAQYILGPFGVDCDLRRHGEAIAARGGKNGKKRAVVAVARKLAVLLHKLWISEAIYDPQYNSKQRLNQSQAA